MNSAIERLVSLRVRDVMNPLPVQLSDSQSVRDAAGVLNEHDISGAPVVDDSGCCVGVLSARDIVRFQVGERAAVDSTSGDDTVADWMTRDVETIGGDVLMTHAARAMGDRHIHRLIVVDAVRKPAGVISSLDIATAMIHAIEE